MEKVILFGVMVGSQVGFFLIYYLPPLFLSCLGKLCGFLSHRQSGSLPQDCRTPAGAPATSNVGAAESASLSQDQSLPPEVHHPRAQGVSQPPGGGDPLPPDAAHALPVATRDVTPPPAAAAAAAASAAGSEPGDWTTRRFDVSSLYSFEVAAKNRDDACPICLGPLHEEKVSLGPCIHIAHTSCLQSWLLKDRNCSCPVCRLPFVNQ